MQAWIISVMERFGYLGVFLMIAIENIFPPIPSEIILTFGGFMTVTTDMNIVTMIISATLGSIVGAIALYFLGSLLGVNRVQAIVKRHGSILRLKPKDIQKSLLFYDRYKNSTVFFCRMVPILRSLISIPAGMARMPLSSFLLLTAAGSLIWNTALIFLGAFMNTAWQSIAQTVSIYSDITLVALLVLFAIAVLVFLYIKSPKSQQILRLFLSTDEAERAKQIWQKSLMRFTKKPHENMSQALALFKCYYFDFEGGSYKKMLRQNNAKIILNKLELFLDNYFKLINLNDLDIYMSRYLPYDDLFVIYLALNYNDLMKYKHQLMLFYYKSWVNTSYGEIKKNSQKILKKIKQNNLDNLLDEFLIINLNNKKAQALLDLDYCAAALLYIYYRQNPHSPFIEDDKKLQIYVMDRQKGKHKKALSNLNLKLNDKILIEENNQKQLYFSELFAN